RFKNDLTSKRLHGGLIHRGKNRACARALVYLPKRSRPTPSVGPRRPAYQWRQLPLRATSPGIGAANKRCSLPQLKTDGSLSPEGLRLGQEFGREVRTMVSFGTRHGRHPVAFKRVSIRLPSVYQNRFENLIIICETD